MNVFRGLMNEKDLLDQIRNSSERRRFPAGTIIYSDGDSCPGIGFLLSGEIRVFKTGEGGGEITLYEIFPGETCVLNALCILTGDHYPANAVTVTDVELLMVPASSFQSLFSEYDEMRRYTFRLLRDRLSTVMELIEEVAFGRMDRRLMDYLLEKSENGKLSKTHQQIANDLGTSREVVSRLLKDLERKGAVRLERGTVRIIRL